MGFLSDLLTAIKRNTLDKTDIDEKIGRGLSSLATNTKNFFTQRQTSSQPTIQSSPVRSSQAYFSPYRSVAPIQSRPPAIRSFQEPKPLSLQDRVNSIVRNTDAYLSNNPTPVSSIVSKMDTGQFDPLPFTGTVAQKLVFKPTAKVLDKAIEKAYKIGKYNLQQKMPEAFDRSGLKRAEKPTTGDYLDVLGGIGVPKIASNVAGGAFGAGMDVLGSGYQVATGQKKLKDIFNNTEEAYDEGYKFASQLMPLEKGFEAIGAIAKTGIPKNVIKTVMDNPVVKKVVQSLKPEEVSGFGSFLRNTLRAGNKSGLSLSTYGALMDAKNGEERLRNIFDQYKTGFVFGSGQHAVMGGAAQLNKSIVEGKLNQFKTRADDIDVAYKNGFINKDEAVKLTEDALYNSRLAKRPKTIISKGDPSKVDLTGGLVSEKVMRSRLSKAGYSKDEINALIRKEQTVTTGGKNKVFTEDIANNLSALNKAYQNNPNVIQTKVPFVEPKTNEAVVKKTTVEEPIVKPGKPPVAVEEKVVSKPKSKLLQDILNDESLTGREKLRKFVEEGLKKKAKGNTPISEILQNKTQEADPQEELVQILRGTKGMTADQIMSKYPDIKLKKDVLAKDVYGNKVKIPDNEVLTPYELKGNKILLQDGETYIVSKNQFQNIKGNSVSKEAKEFAPELKGLEETILGEPLKDVKKTLPADYRVTSSDDWWDVTDIQGNHIVSGNSRQQAIERAIEITNIGKEMKITPRYPRYQLPGGKNYKEILIRAPENKSVINQELKATFDGEEWRVVDSNGEFLAYGKTKTTALNEAKRQLKRLQSENISLYKDRYNIKPFKSPHWDEPNVIAHLRMNERTYKGKKVAFLEELQSDWAREGRSKGFAKYINIEWKKYGNELNTEIGDRSFGIRPEGNNFYVWEDGASLRHPVSNIADAKAEVSRVVNEGAIPNNPHLKNWQELSIKRALKEAVDNDADYFAWINGEQTSARYNLATYVKNVKWNKENFVELNTKEARRISFQFDKKTGIIDWVDPTSNARTDASIMKGKKLDEVLGKGLADKIMGKESGTLSGEGLKFGGEWADNLYGSTTKKGQVANIVEDLTGGKVIGMDMRLPISKEANVWKNVGDSSMKPLTESQLKIGKEIYRNQTDNYIITDILGDGKFKAVPKKIIDEAKLNNDTLSFHDESKLVFNRDGSVNTDKTPKYSIKLQEYIDRNATTFDISKKTTTQQGIKLTPEIKAKIRGEAPNFSASGKQFEEVKQSPNITKSEVQKPKETGLIENKETVLKRILEGRSSIDPEKFAKENEARIEKLKKYNVPEIQKGFTEEEQKTLRRTLEIMDNTTKDLDPSKASKILVNAMNKSPEKKQRIMNLMKDADFSKPDSIKKFWSDVKNIQSKNLSEILPEKTKEANVVDTKLKTIESVIKNSNERQGSEFIVEKANELPNYVSKKNITSNEQASSESNRFMSEHMSVGEAVKREAKKYGVKGEDIVEMIEGRKEAPKGFDKTIEAVHNYTDGLHKFRENESLGYLNDYVQHIPDKAVSSAQKINVGVDVWLPVEAVELGSTKKRLGKLGEGYSRDFDKVWERMGQEAYYDKYKGNFNISAKQREFRNKVLETIKTETEKSVEPQKSKFDFVDESSKAQEIKEKQKINYNARKGLYRFEHFVEYVGKESKSLQNAARDLRDADRIYDDFLKNKDNLSDEKWAEEIGKTLKLSRREITNISDDLKGFTGDANLLYRRGVLSNLKRVITQNFMDEVGKYEFEPETKKQLNYEIDKAIRVRAIEEGLYKKAVDMGTSLAYASQIWGNARVAIQQGTEAFRMMTIDPIASAKAFVDIIKRPQELFKKVNEYGFTENDYHNLTREVNGLAKKNDWFRKVFDKLDIVGSGPVRFFEDAKNEFFLTAYEIKGKDMGLKGKELRNYIRDNLFLNGYIMDKFNTPQYLRTPTGRLFGQYSQYFVKDMERMYDAVAIEKNPVLMAKLLTAKLASAYVMAKITGQVVDWLSMPVGFGAIPTYVKNMYQIVKDTKDEEQRAKDDPDYNSTYFRDTMKTRLINATLRTLVPFGVQYKKTSSAIDEQKKGYGETLRGRVTHKAEDDPIRILQTYFFGPSAGRYNQEFYKKEGGLFNSGADLPFYPATRKYYSASDTRSKKIKEIFASGDKERGQNMIDDNLARQDVYRDKDKELTPADREIIKSFNLRKERDENGNILDTINNKRISMSEANNKLAYPELLKFITERELEVARKTDLPLNPFYLLTPEQQRTYLNIKSLPKGDPKGKELKKISEKWLPDFYKANEKYVKDAIEQGIFTENPNFDDSRLKISPELQKKIDKYFTLDKEGRKAFIKQNPDVADYFELTRLLENVELIQMGFLPNTDSYSGGRGYSGGRKSSKSLSSFTNKSISALDRFLKSIPKEKPILISDILKKKSKPKEYKFKKINPKPSIKVK